MPSLVEKLQRDALDQKVSVTELLQKCLVVATKAGPRERTGTSTGVQGCCLHYFSPMPAYAQAPIHDLTPREAGG